MDGFVVNVAVEMHPTLVVGGAGTLASRPELPEVVHVLGVSGSGMVREVPQRAPIISQPLADFQFQVSTSFESGGVYQLLMMTPGDVGERLDQRAGLSRM